MIPRLLAVLALLASLLAVPTPAAAARPDGIVPRRPVAELPVPPRPWREGPIYKHPRRS